MSDITRDRLVELIDYNPDSGVFVWNDSGKVAGYLNSDNGYIIIMIDGKNYRAHRLAFLFIDYSIPDELVDHLNHIRDDNRWVNLSRATTKTNSKNKSINSNNSSGVTGVYWSSNRWRANICVDSKTICLGRFSEFSDAVNARKNAEVMYGFHENHGKPVQQSKGIR